MATVAKGVASFTSGGAETASFTWVDAVLLTPVVFGATPTIVFGPSTTVTDGTGDGVPYWNGAGQYNSSGGTVTMANPPTCTVTVVAIG